MLGPLTSGLIVGAGYALMALGVVLIFKASKRFNFAQGEFGTISVFAAWLTLERVDSWALAAIAGILAAVGTGLVVERLVIRPLMSSPPVTVLVATAGVALLAIALQIIFGESKLRAIRPAVTGRGFSVGMAQVAPQSLLIVVGLIVVGGALYLFFRSPIGTALLATAQEPFAARLAGIDTNKMAMLTWGIAGLCGGVAGLLFAPLAGFTPGFMTTQRLIPGFTAAVLGGMTSLPGAVVGGFAVGLIEALSGYFFSDHIAGADLLGVFVALLIVLFVRPQGLLGKEA